MQISLPIRVLQRAVELTGGQRQLARTLRVPLPTLSLWLKGGEEVPRNFFLAAVDVLIEYDDSLSFMTHEDFRPQPPGNDAAADQQDKAG